MVRFPHVAVIMAAAPSTLPWVEIYKLQLRSEKKVTAKAPELKPSDFVISFEITFKGKVVIEEAHALPDEQIHHDRLCTKELWSEETAPEWLKDAWENDYEGWQGDTASLSVWLTRDWKTIQITNKAHVGDGDYKSTYFDHQELRVEFQDMGVQVDLCEANGSLEVWFDTASRNDLKMAEGLRVLASMLAAI